MNLYQISDISPEIIRLHITGAGYNFRDKYWYVIIRTKEGFKVEMSLQMFRDFFGETYFFRYKSAYRQFVKQWFN